MKKRDLLWTVSFAFVSCDFGPAPLKLGEAPRTNAQHELTIPLNVTKAFSPTGYFYNVWPPADSTFTQVDPEKWNNFLAYQSIFQHPTCADRVPLDTLAKYDSTLARFVTPSQFYEEFNCTQFTYAPVAEDDLYGGVFWLRNNNFGNHPGVKVDAGARRVKFWARSDNPGITVVKFGVGVNNSSVLKPWYYFSEYVDTWGEPIPVWADVWVKKRLHNSEGKVVDSVVVGDTVRAGSGTYLSFNLTRKWTHYEVDLGILYAFNFRKDTVKVGDSIVVNETPFDSLPDHDLIGAFFWAMESAFIKDSSHVTETFTMPDGTRRRARYGSGTVLIDGIRYEK